MRRCRPASPPHLGTICRLILATLLAAGAANAKRIDPAANALEKDAGRAVVSALGAPEPAGDCTVWRDGATGDVRRAAPNVGAIAPAKSGAEADRARLFLEERADLFGLGGVVGELETEFVKRGLASTHVVFRRVIDGIPTSPGKIGVHFDRDGRILYTDLAVDRRPAPATKSAAVSAAVAMSAASAGLVSSTEPWAELLWIGSAGGLRLAWRVSVPATEPAGLWVSVVDASTGELVERYNRSPRVTGSGRVWSPNPVNVLQTQDLYDMNDADQAVFDPAYVIVPLQGLDPPETPGQYRLKGPYVEIVDFESPVIAPPVASDPDSFRVSRANDTFEAVMAYYHIDKIQRYLRGIGYDGVSIGPGGLPNDSIVVSPIPVDVHGWGQYPADQQDNSRYDPPPTHRLSFGDGCVDDAEEADVIVHEYGHAIEFSQAPDWGYPAGYMGAMAEGFSDYWAESHAARVGVAYGLGQVFDWDLGPRDSCWLGRRVDNTATMDDLRPLTPNYVYDNSQIWSGSLWDLHQVLGGAYTDSLILEAHFFFNGSAPNVTFADAAYAVLQADRAFTGGAHQDEIFTVFQGRGILTGENVDAPTILAASHPEFNYGGGAVLCTLSLRTEVPIRSVTVISGVSSPAGDTIDLAAASGETLWVGSLAPPVGADSILYFYRVLDLFEREVLRPDSGHYRTRILADELAPVIASPPMGERLDSELPALLSATVTDNSAVDPDSVIAFWRFDGPAGSDSGAFALVVTGGDSVFTGFFPEGPGRVGRYEYRVLAVDLSGARNRAYAPPAGLDSFRVREDVVAPVIGHTPIPSFEEGETKPSIVVTITDDGALNPDSLFVEYAFEGARGASAEGTVPLAATGGDAYEGQFPGLPESTGAVSYRVVAVDAALAKNRTASPTEGYYSFAIYPASFRLALDGPNPFADHVAFTLFLAEDAEARFEIYDIAGRRVRSDDRALARGAAAWEWDGRNSDGRRVAPGIYFYRVSAGSFEATGRLVHLR